MNTLTNLLKDYQIGTWCRRIAWVIVVVYLIQMSFGIYSVAQLYGPSTPPPFNSGEFVRVMLYAIPYIPIMLFDFFILYAAGAVVDYFIGQDEEEEALDDEEEELIAP